MEAALNDRTNHRQPNPADPYYRNDAVSLLWYRDRDVCKQVDSRDALYDMELLRRMYDYLSTRGDCCYIEYEGELVGDVSLQDNAELPLW